MKLHLSILVFLLSFQSHAHGYYPEPMPHDQTWAITASIGTGEYNHIQTSPINKNAFGRIALSNELLLTGDFAWGLELGLQAGNKVYLPIPPETITLLEWLPVKTSIGPMLDLLITAKSDPLIGSAFFAQLKGGLVYRNWHVEHYGVNDVTELTSELQAGLGYPITALANLNLLYQGVWGNNPNFMITPATSTGQLSHIPTLHAVLLGLSVNI